MSVEWVHLGEAGRAGHAIGCVVGDAHRSWLHQPQMGQFDPFEGPMTGPGSPDTTRHLLDGAIAAGLRQFPGAPVAAMDADNWAWHLCGYFHLTTHTPGLLGQAGDKFTANGRAKLADWAYEKQREENGHDQLALLDLKGLGIDGRAMVKVAVPPVAAAMIAAFKDAATADLPLGVIAYAHTVERLALTLDQAHIDSIRALFPAGVRATRCLKVHSGTGTDAGHVEENVVLVASLSADERRTIALACFEIARIWSKSQSTGRVDHAWLRALLDRFRRSNGHVESE